MRHTIRDRIAAAISAFRNPPKQRTLAIIYDRREGIDGADSEEYYAYFDDEGEATHLFDCFRSLSSSHGSIIHNAYLVELVKELIPHCED